MDIDPFFRPGSRRQPLNHHGSPKNRRVNTLVIQPYHLLKEEFLEITF